MIGAPQFAVVCYSNAEDAINCGGLLMVATMVH